MADVSVNLDNAALTYGGEWRYSYRASQRCRTVVGSGNELEFTATGTQCTLRYAVSATGTNYLQVSVDGGALTDITGPGSINTYTDCTLFTGLSDAAHTVRVKHNAGTQTNVFVQYANGITATGASPAISLTSGMGPTYNVGFHEYASAIHFEGQSNIDGSGGHIRLNLTQPDSRLRFKSNCTSIKIFSPLNSASLRVMQDGVAIGSKINLGSSGFGWTEIASGLSGTHTYEIVCVTALALRLMQIQLVGGTLDTASPPAYRPSILILGDSKAMGGSGVADTSICFPSLVGAAKGYAIVNSAISGNSVLSTGTGGTIETDNPVSYPPQNEGARDFSYVVFAGGHNDNGNDMTEFEASCVRLFTKLKTAYSNAVILALGVFNTTVFNSTVRGNLNTAISNAAATVGGITYVNTDDWINPATDTSDGTHPNAGGHVLIAAELEAEIVNYSPAAGGGGSGIRGIMTGGAL